jgi:aminoglycoside phosphotransferase (APT) family kinase protein
MIDLKFLHVDHNMFLAGANLGDKLPNPRFSSAKMQFDPTTNLVYVTYNGETGFFSHHHAWMMVEGSAKKVLQMHAKAQDAHDTTQRNPLNAQVSTPQGHVHAGPGAGLTGQEEVKRGPGRPPKAPA